MNAFPLNASFQEKSALITLVSLLAVVVAYGIVAGRMLAAGVTVAAPYLPLLLMASVLLAVVMGVGHAVAAALAPPEAADERDRAIACRAEQRSSWVLASFVFVAIVALAMPVGTAWVANGLLAGMFASEIAKSALQLWYYRRGL